jgi:hypothetical protein
MTRYTPLWEQAGSYPASVDRSLIASLAGPAYPLVRGCAVTVSAGTMNMNIAPGSVAVPTPNNTGSVLCYSDAVEVVSSPTAPASGTNRIDVVVCQARGNDLDGGSNNDFLFQVVAGVASATPAVPATPAGAVALAQITVIGGAASLNAANLLDRRILQPWAQPWGILGYGERAAALAINAEATIPESVLTFNTVANRRIKSTTFGQGTSSTQAIYWTLYIKETATYFNGGQQATVGANQPGSVTIVTVQTPALGPHTWQVTGVTGSAGGSLMASGTAPKFMHLIEDIGPAGAPAL